MDTGKLERKAVLKAICAGFEETTEPNVCLSDGKNNKFNTQMYTE
jgi:hypothetical protein